MRNLKSRRNVNRWCVCVCLCAVNLFNYCIVELKLLSLHFFLLLLSLLLSDILHPLMLLCTLPLWIFLHFFYLKFIHLFVQWIHSIFLPRVERTARYFVHIKVFVVVPFNFSIWKDFFVVNKHVHSHSGFVFIHVLDAIFCQNILAFCICHSFALLCCVFERRAFIKFILRMVKWNIYTQIITFESVGWLDHVQIRWHQLIQFDDLPQKPANCRLSSAIHMSWNVVLDWSLSPFIARTESCGNWTN